jgi:DNA modification methylase
LAVTEQLSFTRLESVSNQNSIHGIYPYRGKISSLDAANVINQLPHDKVLLDPFCGSGTIVYEAAKRLRYAIGMDNNPIAIQIAKGKISQFSPDASMFRLRRIIEKIDLSSRCSTPSKAERYFHPDTANEIMLLKQHYDEFNDFEKAVFLGTICLVARECNHYRWSSTQIGKLSDNKRYVNFFDRFLYKIVKHGYPLPNNNAKVILGDARKMSELIPLKSVNVIYTSPPYFDCLDYTSYYTRIVHYVFGSDIEGIRSGLIQNRATYEEDMVKCFDEIEKVTTDDAIIIFVVGDKKVGGKVISGGDFFSGISRHKPLQILEREYTKTASKIWDSINKTNRKEQIVVWDKSRW